MWWRILNWWPDESDDRADAPADGDPGNPVIRRDVIADQTQGSTETRLLVEDGQQIEARGRGGPH
jgi:DNA-directed RNA polymerase subunit beta'